MAVYVYYDYRNCYLTILPTSLRADNDGSIFLFSKLLLITYPFNFVFLLRNLIEQLLTKQKVNRIV